MGDNNKFDFKNVVDQLNIVKHATEIGINIQDRAMDVCDKHLKGSNIVRESKQQELNKLTQERDEDLSRLNSIKDLSELYEKKQKIHDFYNPKINRIESELKNCDNEKMINAEKIINAGAKALKTTVILLGASAAGYGATKLIKQSQDESALECIVEVDDNEEVLKNGSNID